MLCTQSLVRHGDADGARVPATTAVTSCTRPGGRLQHVQRAPAHERTSPDQAASREAATHEHRLHGDGSGRRRGAQDGGPQKQYRHRRSLLAL